MDLRMLFYTFLLVPWILFTTAQRGQKDRQDGSFLRVGLDVKKNKVTPAPAYESVNASEVSASEKKESEKDTCKLCVCLFGSVYCEEVSPEMRTIPALPKETKYLYARFNKITKITQKDFVDVGSLKRIDLTGNLISEIDDGAFSTLDQLEELSLAENRLIKLPLLPQNLISLNANHNQLRTKGIRTTVLKKLKKLAYLYLGDNELEAIPPLPESLHIVHLHNNYITTLMDETFCKGNDTQYIRHKMQEVRLDGNPLVLAQHPNSFICLRDLPIGFYK